MLSGLNGGGGGIDEPVGIYGKLHFASFDDDIDSD